MADPGAPAHISKGQPAEATDLIIVRRRRLVSTLARPHGGILLDFGCGSGSQTLLFAEQFDRVIAVDVDPAFVADCARRAADAGLAERVRCMVYDGRNLPIDDESVDFAVSFEVLEHVDDETRALSELHRVLKPGATLAMSVPNRWWIFETHGAALPLLRWNRVPFFSWLPKPLHDRWAHARIYSRREIVRKIQAAVRTSVYVTAPMDVVRNRRVQRWLRTRVFRGDQTLNPFLSTAVLVVAARR
jgi:ubiquinone/menaquinone biosynthesis C-methylase UbiE